MTHQSLQKYSSWHGFAVPHGLGVFASCPRATVPQGNEDKVLVSSARICLTLGCLCRAQTALKAEGYPNL